MTGILPFAFSIVEKYFFIEYYFLVQKKQLIKKD